MREFEAQKSKVALNMIECKVYQAAFDKRKLDFIDSFITKSVPGCTGPLILRTIRELDDKIESNVQFLKSVLVNNLNSYAEMTLECVKCGKAKFFEATYKVCSSEDREKALRIMIKNAETFNSVHSNFFQNAGFDSTLLLKFCLRAGRPELALELINHYAMVSFNYEIVVLAIGTGNDSLIKVMLEGNSLSKNSKFKEEAFLLACKMGELDAVRYLASSGVEVTETALDLAASNKQLAVLEYLFSKYKSFGSSLKVKLLEALMVDGEFEMFKHIFLLGEANVMMSKRLLRIAAKKMNLEIAKYILDKSNETERFELICTDKSPLSISAANNDAKFTREIILYIKEDRKECLEEIILSSDSVTLLTFLPASSFSSADLLLRSLDRRNLKIASTLCGMTDRKAITEEVRMKILKIIATEMWYMDGFKFLMLHLLPNFPIFQDWSLSEERDSKKTTLLHVAAKSDWTLALPHMIEFYNLNGKKEELCFGRSLDDGLVVVEYAIISNNEAFIYLLAEACFSLDGSIPTVFNFLIRHKKSALWLFERLLSKYLFRYGTKERQRVVFSFLDEAIVTPDRLSYLSYFLQQGQLENEGERKSLGSQYIHAFLLKSKLNAESLPLQVLSIFLEYRESEEFKNIFLSYAYGLNHKLKVQFKDNAAGKKQAAASVAINIAAIYERFGVNPKLNGEAIYELVDDHDLLFHLVRNFDIFSRLDVTPLIYKCTLPERSGLKRTLSIIREGLMSRHLERIGNRTLVMFTETLDLRMFMEVEPVSLVRVSDGLFVSDIFAFAIERRQRKVQVPAMYQQRKKSFVASLGFSACQTQAAQFFLNSDYWFWRANTNQLIYPLKLVPTDERDGDFHVMHRDAEERLRCLDELGHFILPALEPLFPGTYKCLVVRVVKLELSVIPSSIYSRRQQMTYFETKLLQ